MKAVLMSIQPKWSEKIASGEKTIEVRKSCPKLETPFKVYIYATWNGSKKEILVKQDGQLFCKDWRKANGLQRASGKVIGEFVCDEIREVYQCNSGWVAENACVMRSEFFKYLGIPQDTHFGYDKKAYAWHITDLKIYEEPKELSEFEFPKDNIYLSYRKRNQYFKGITRPPQSWCYVEDLESVSR